jgi:hypothetical protein
MSFEIKVDMKVANYGDIIKQAAEETANNIRDRGRADTAAAGFGRWAKRLTVPVRKVHGGYKIEVRQMPGFMKVYEQGGTSSGKAPSGLLWIPAPGRKQRLSKYRGPKLIRRGNVLIGRDHKVKYVGIPSHKHQKRLHLRAIAQDETNKFMAKMMPLIRSSRAKP